MKTLPSSQEHRIIAAAERVVDLANSGLSPNDALYKVSTDERLTPEFVKRLGEVYNVSRTLHHFKTAEASKRADEFPLADAHEVLTRMYPAKPEPVGVKAARASRFSTWFSAPPDFTKRQAVLEKAAFAAVPVESSHGPADINMLVARSLNHVDSLKRAAEVTREDEHYAREMLRRSVIKAAEYFQSLSHVPFDAVEGNILTQHGAVAKPLMDAVYTACRGARFGEKRGHAYDTERVMDDSVSPYQELSEALRWARETVKIAAERHVAYGEYESFKTALAQRMTKLSGRSSRDRRIPFPFDVPIKISSGGVLPAVASGTWIGKNLRDITSDESAAFEADVGRALDPNHETELRAMRSRALLNDLLTNDPVISGYPPARVISAFNEISQMTPRVSDQPGLLRGLLSRRLEMGRTEPIEAAQFIDAETGLRNIEQPSTSQGFRRG